MAEPKPATQSGELELKVAELEKDLARTESSEAVDDHHHLFPRNGDRWKATYHNVTAMLGAGVLGLPSTFAYLGWAGGVICLGVFLFVSWYTFILLVRMHELPPKEPGGKIRRFNQYSDLSQFLLGRVTGWWALAPFQIALLYGVAVTYAVTGANNMKAMATIQGGAEDVDKISYWILIFCAAQLVFCLVPNFSELGWVSLMGAAMSGFYSVAGTIMSGMYPADNVIYKPQDVGRTTAQTFFGIFSALSTVAFAFGGHNIALEIQATIPAGPNESTIPPMMFSVHVAFVFTGICYFAVACAGFWAYGATVPSNILDAITSPSASNAITAAHLAVVLHVISSYQVYSYPLYDSIEVWFIKKFPEWQLEQRPRQRWFVRMAIRWIYVLSTAFIACLIPFFGDLMNLLGAATITPTTFVLPPILWLYYKKPGRYSFDWWLAMVVAVVMTAIGAVGTIAAVRGIILSASTYKPFT